MVYQVRIAPTFSAYPLHLASGDTGSKLKVHIQPNKREKPKQISDSESNLVAGYKLKLHFHEAKHLIVLRF
jgi:hypothetical protein